MRKMFFALSVLAILAISLAACAAPSTPVPATATQPAAVSTEPPAPTDPPAPTATALPAFKFPEGCLGTAEEAIADLDCEEITIAVENAYLPFNYIAIETGEPGGWDYEAWAEICTRLHCTPLFVEASWEGMIQAVADGQFDAAGDGITITDDRAQVVDFSIGYINIVQRLLVRSGDTRFASIEEFVDGDFILGTQVATTNYETAIDYLPEDRIRAFDQFPFAVQALIAGDVDAVILDEVIGMGYMGVNADQVELIGPPISSDELGFIFPKGSELTDYVNQALTAMQQDGFLADLNVRYFGPEFDITYDDIQ